MRCPICNKEKQLTLHHKFHQNKVNKKLYGDLIHDTRNLFPVCLDCHLTKTLPSYTERQFCEVLGIEPRSKSGSRSKG